MVCPLRSFCGSPAVQRVALVGLVHGVPTPVFFRGSPSRVFFSVVVESKNRVGWSEHRFARVTATWPRTGRRPSRLDGWPVPPATPSSGCWGPPVLSAGTWTWPRLDASMVDSAVSCSMMARCGTRPAKDIIPSVSLARWIDVTATGEPQLRYVCIVQRGADVAARPHQFVPSTLLTQEDTWEVREVAPLAAARGWGYDDSPTGPFVDPSAAPRRPTASSPAGAAGVAVRRAGACVGRCCAGVYPTVRSSTRPPPRAARRLFPDWVCLSVPDGPCRGMPVVRVCRHHPPVRAVRGGWGGVGGGAGLPAAGVGSGGQRPAAWPATLGCTVVPLAAAPVVGGGAG